MSSVIVGLAHPPIIASGAGRRRGAARQSSSGRDDRLDVVDSRAGTRRSARPRSSRCGAPRANSSRYGKRAGEPSSCSTSQITATGAQAREPGEVDRGLGVPATVEHAAVAGAQREDVAGPDEVLGPGRSGRGTRWMVSARSAAPMPDPASRWSIVTVNAVSHPAWLGGTIGPISSLSSQVPSARHAHEAARPAEHEVERFRRSPNRRPSAGRPRSRGLRRRPRAPSRRGGFGAVRPRSESGTPSPSFADGHGNYRSIWAGPELGAARPSAGASWSSIRPGMRTTIRQPCGSRRSARMSPPCNSTIQRAIARPSPAPPSRDERAESAR